MAKQLYKRDLTKHGVLANRVLCAVRPIINKWDPMRLLKIGAPEDEYEGEITHIAYSSYRMTNSRITGEVVYEVFCHEFAGCGAPPLVECLEYGEKIFSAVSKIMDAAEAEWRGKKKESKSGNGGSKEICVDAVGGEGDGGVV